MPKVADAAKFHGDNRIKQAAAEAKVADLERQLAEVTAKKAKRWWQL